MGLFRPVTGQLYLLSSCSWIPNFLIHPRNSITLPMLWCGRTKKITSHVDVNKCGTVLPAIRTKQSFSTHQCTYTASCVECCAWRSRNTHHSSTRHSVYRNSCHHTPDTPQEPEECVLNTAQGLLRLSPHWRPFAFRARASNGCSCGFQLRRQCTPEGA